MSADTIIQKVQEDRRTADIQIIQALGRRISENVHRAREYAQHREDIVKLYESDLSTDELQRLVVKAPGADHYIAKAAWYVRKGVLTYLTDPDVRTAGDILARTPEFLGDLEKIRAYPEGLVHEALHGIGFSVPWGVSDWYGDAENDGDGIPLACERIEHEQDIAERNSINLFLRLLYIHDAGGVPSDADFAEYGKQCFAKKRLEWDAADLTCLMKNKAAGADA